MILGHYIVTSTYHLMIKFPTEYGVGEVRGDQVVACECYITMLEMDDHLQTVYRRTMDSSRTGELEKVLLDDSMPRRTMRIGTLASPPVRQALKTFLRKN